MKLLKLALVTLAGLSFAFSSIAQPAKSTGKQEKVEMDYQLPGRTSEFCRKKVERMEQKYRKKISETPGRKSELRKAFYEKVPAKLESCKPPPRIVNVSEAPGSMPERCVERIRRLNEKIKSKTNASVGSKVPGSYRKEYENALKGCVAGAAVSKLREKLMKKIFGNAEKSVPARLFRDAMESIRKMVIANPQAIKKSDIRRKLEKSNSTRKKSGILDGIRKGFGTFLP